MENRNKELYEAPSTIVLEVGNKGVLCASKVFVLFGNSVNDWEDGGTINDEIYM